MLVLIELVTLLRLKGRLSAYSKTVLAGTAWIYLVLFGLMAVVQVVETDWTPPVPASKRMKLIASARWPRSTTGRPGLSIEGAAAICRAPGQWLLLAPQCSADMGGERPVGSEARARSSDSEGWTGIKRRKHQRRWQHSRGVVRRSPLGCFSDDAVGRPEMAGIICCF
jgi:hypothetical protein